jgi:hypothetical protein
MPVRIGVVLLAFLNSNYLSLLLNYGSALGEKPLGIRERGSAQTNQAINCFATCTATASNRGFNLH